MKRLAFIFVGLLIGFSSVAQTAGKSEVIHLTDKSFKEKVFDFEKNKEWNYIGDKPCLVDFYATWCGPCKRVAPILEQLQKEYGGAIQIYKVDTDKAPAVSAAFGIRSIPSLLFIPAKGKPQMAQGALAKDDFIKAIKEVLGVEYPKALIK